MILTGSERLWDFAARDRVAIKALTTWANIVARAKWRSPSDVIGTLGKADPSVRVASGRRVAVFNVRGNHYRVIAAVDYPTQVVNVLRVMTHADYSRDTWKDQL
jgi:mRNA interferase HigB